MCEEPSQCEFSHFSLPQLWLSGLSEARGEGAYTCHVQEAARSGGSRVSAETSPGNTPHEPGSRRHPGGRCSHQAAKASPPRDGKERLDWDNGPLLAGGLWDGRGVQKLTASGLAAARWGSPFFAAVHPLPRLLPPLPWPQTAFWLSCSRWLALAPVLPPCVPDHRLATLPHVVAWAACIQPYRANQCSPCRPDPAGCHNPRRDPAQGPGPLVRVATHCVSGAITAGAVPVMPCLSESCAGSLRPYPTRDRQRADPSTARMPTTLP